MTSFKIIPSICRNASLSVALRQKSIPVVASSSRLFLVTSPRYYSNGSTTSESSTSQESPAKDQEKQENSANTEQQQPDYQKLLKEKDDQIATLRSAYQIALADAENVRQRTKRELADKEVYAIQKFAKDLLDTVDVLAMALDSVPESVRSSSNDGDEGNKDLNNLYTGVSMTRNQLLKTLSRFGVEPIDALDKPFDPNMHQALFQAPIPNKEAGIVFQVTKAGYKIGERVLRPAQVGVVKAPDA